MKITEIKTFIGENRIKEYTQFILDNVYNGINISWIDTENDIITICYDLSWNNLIISDLHLVVKSTL